MTLVTSDPPRRLPLTRASVVASAREVVVAEGVDALSLRKIGRKLGVTAPALYAYVDDREDLLRAVAGEALAQLRARFEAIVVADPIDHLRQQCRVYVDFALENPSLFGAMFIYPPELAVAEPLGVESEEATSVFAMAADAIEAAVAEGAIDPPDDPTIATLAMWATVHGVATVLTMGFEFDAATREALVRRATDGALAVLGIEPR